MNARNAIIAVLLILCLTLCSCVVGGRPASRYASSPYDRTYYAPLYGPAPSQNVPAARPSKPHE